MTSLIPTPDDAVEVARELDSQIRQLARHAHVVLEALRALVEVAKADNIHETLGYPSWTAYLADALDGQWKLDRDKRGEVVRFLAEQGMSQRAITKATGVARSTVQRELEQVAHLGQVLGLDGKTYTRPEPGAQVAHDGPPAESDEEFLARMHTQSRTFTIPDTPDAMKATLEQIHADAARLERIKYEMEIAALAELPRWEADAREFGLRLRRVRWIGEHYIGKGPSQRSIEEFAEEANCTVEQVQDILDMVDDFIPPGFPYTLLGHGDES